MSKPTGTKAFILEHVLYEMEMYLYTFPVLFNPRIQGKIEYNVFWNAHNVALRNLYYFFSAKNKKFKDDINTDFSFADKPLIGKEYSDYIKAIDKAINHLAARRFIGFNENHTLDQMVIEAIQNLYPVLSDYIKTFIYQLENENVIYRYYDSDQNDYFEKDLSEELKNETIIKIIDFIKCLLQDYYQQESNS